MHARARGLSRAEASFSRRGAAGLVDGNGHRVWLDRVRLAERAAQPQRSARAAVRRAARHPH
eukprot:1088698-Pleurochrysis_carterae.AAC.1